MAAVYVRLLRHQGRFQEALDLAARHLADDRLDQSTRRDLHRLSAGAWEALGRYDLAFQAYADANRVGARPFDEVSYRQSIDALVETFSATNLPRLPRASNRSGLPVFIVSMPRAGSTLVEQIIHAHPRAHAAGEIAHLNRIIAYLPETLGSPQPYPACVADLTTPRLDELSRSYLEELKKLGRAAIRVTNKHPENVRDLGMISLMLPAARVIHVRREPADNCFSCFMAGLAPGKLPWASDLRHLGFVYRQYERLMAHWRGVLDIPMLEVRYEDLVSEPDPWIRRIIDFCGLEWDEGCLRFHEARRNVVTLSYDQVRRPIYRSAVGRWRNYEAHLGPLQEALAGECPA